MKKILAVILAIVMCLPLLGCRRKKKNSYVYTFDPNNLSRYTEPYEKDEPYEKEDSFEKTEEEDCITCVDGTCVICDGSGLCPYCEGTGEMLCRTCNGMDIYIHAGTSRGERSEDCYSSTCKEGIEKCWSCEGSKRCFSCEGQKRCFTCLGAGDYSLIDKRKTVYSYDYLECEDCNGTGIDTCPVCSDGSCSSCGGDGRKKCNHYDPDKCDRCDNGYYECTSCRGYKVCNLCNGVYEKDCIWCIDGVDIVAYGFKLPIDQTSQEDNTDNRFGELCSFCGGRGSVNCPDCTLGKHNSCSGKGCTFCYNGWCYCLDGYNDCPYCEEGYPNE